MGGGTGRDGKARRVSHILGEKLALLKWCEGSSYGGALLLRDRFGSAEERRAQEGTIVTEQVERDMRRK